MEARKNTALMQKRSTFVPTETTKSVYGPPSIEYGCTCDILRTKKYIFLNQALHMSTYIGMIDLMKISTNWTQQRFTEMK